MYFFAKEEIETPCQKHACAEPAVMMSREEQYEGGLPGNQAAKQRSDAVLHAFGGYGAVIEMAYAEECRSQSGRHA